VKLEILKNSESRVTLEDVIACHFQSRPDNNHIISRYLNLLKRSNDFPRFVAGINRLERDGINEFMGRIQERLPATFDQLIPLAQSSQTVYLVLCTIGPRMEEEIGRLTERGNIADAFIMDTIGSIAVAKFAKEVYEKLSKRESGRNLCLSSPIMPGTRTVDLELNQIVFGMMDSNAIGMELTRHSVMMPSKSLAMIVGEGPQVKTGSAGHDCRHCSKKGTCYIKQFWALENEPERATRSIGAGGVAS
jgi:hypothetical protein